MENTLPARPHLDHLRGQAKALLAQLQAGEEPAATLFITHLPAARGLSLDKVRNAGYRLADAQSVVARSTGFASWPSLARHVEQLRSMEGTWDFESLQIDGYEVPAGHFGSSRLLIDGDRFRMESPEAIYEGVFNIDVEAPNQSIDIEFVEGPEAGNSSYGIFEIDGDRLCICLGMVGSTRPTDFISKPNTGHALETLRRSSASRPPAVDGGVAPTRRPAAVIDRSDFENLSSPVLEKLQGEWTPVVIVKSGAELPPNFMAVGKRVAIGAETTVSFGGQVIINALTKIDDSQSPAHIDYLVISGPDAGAIQLGIMEWVGDQVQFCFSNPGSSRPTEFVSPAGSDVTLSRWRRT